MREDSVQAEGPDTQLGSSLLKGEVGERSDELQRGQHAERELPVEYVG